MNQRDPISVLIADDQRLMLDGLRTLLELEPDLDVVEAVEDGEAAVGAYERLHPDVVLMDILMPGMDGVEATRRICDRWPEARVIILTTFDDDAYVFEGIRAGASGYLLKAIEGAELARTIRTVAAGGSFMEPSVARKMMRELLSLHELAIDFEKAKQLPIRITVPDSLPPLPEAHRLAVYRAAQEALTNVQRHAQASQASLTIGLSAEALTLCVRDNGIGLPNEAEQQGFGLRGMRERIMQLGGSVELRSAKPDGTTVLVQLPNTTGETP